MDNQSQDKLNSLFAAYREACPDPEGSASFMPSIWEKISLRRPPNWLSPLVVWARRLSAAATLAAALLLFSLGGPSQQVDVLETSYLEALQADSAEEYEDLWLLAGNTR